MNFISKLGFAFIIFSLFYDPAIAQRKAPDAPLQVNADTVSLTQFHEKKVMLWFFSTWCPSCQAGLKALKKKEGKLKKLGLHIIAVRNYKNGGYPGPSINDFVKKAAPSLLTAQNWTLAEATKELAQKYNSRGYPDIYYLISPEGKIVNVAGSPGGHMDQIMAFARSK